MKIQFRIWYWEWRLKWAKVKKWFYENEPIFCSDCKKLVRRKNVSWETTVTGQELPLCKKCHAKWFPAPEHPNCNCIVIPEDVK